MSRFSLSQIDLRVLKVFIDVVDHEGFSAVAEAKGISLSTVTRDISALETRLGLRLCVRGRKGFSLTPEGDEVYRAARQLMVGLQEFEASLAATQATLPNALDVGIVENMVSNPDCMVGDLLQDLHRRYKTLSVRVGVHPVFSIDRLVRDRRLDFGFTTVKVDLPPLIYRPAFIERHALFVSRNCPHFGRILAWRPGDAGELLPYIARSFAKERFTSYENIMPLKPQGFGSGAESVLTAVAAGFGIGMLPVHLAKNVEHLVPLEFPESRIAVPFYFVARRDSARQDVISACIRYFDRLENGLVNSA